MKALKITLISLALISIYFSPVLAQYDVDVVEPRYEDGAEVFGIETTGDKQISIYPEGCKSVERVILEIKGEVKGEIKVSSLGEENPKEDKKLENVYEFCAFEYRDIDRGNIKSIKVDIKVRKSWLESNNIEDGDIGAYIFDEDWKYKKTTKEKDNSIYVFYNSEIEFTDYLAVAEYQGGDFLPFGLSPWVVFICCIFLLFIILLLSILYSISGRGERKGGVQ